MCIVVIVVINMKAKQAENDLLKQTQDSTAEITGLLPELNQEVLDAVKDKTDNQRVILEQAAFKELGTKVRILITQWFAVVGKTFDFENSEANSSELRGNLFRLRGELLDAEPITRVADEEPEYWCHIRSDDGHEFFYVSMMMPSELFGVDNFVLADGYFFKYYRQKMGDEWVTAPLFVGRQLAPSWKRLDPATQPDMELLARVRDQPIGTDNRVENLNTMPEMWHLANVAKTVASDPEALATTIAEPLVIDYEMLKKISENPEIYRGQLFEFGGMFAGRPSTVRIGENPMRETKMSSAWIRNDFVGDVLVHLKAPGVFPFDIERDPMVFHGYFLMLWAYLDTESIPRRTPVFVVVNSFTEDPVTPPFAGQMVLMFLGVAIGFGILLFMLVRRDRRNSDLAMQKILDRRQNRSS